MEYLIERTVLAYITVPALQVRADVVEAGSCQWALICLNNKLNPFTIGFKIFLVF